jgi:exodeoxyribonuclease VII large subunit
MQPALFQPSSVTVSDITRYLRQLMESDEILRDVWVLGEISNLSRPASGHVYFTMKDDLAALRCVIWRTAMGRIKTGMQNGMAIEAHGYISLYERDGQYQLYVDTFRAAGEGYLYQEFLRLKARLEAEGLFDEGRKRPLPLRPQRIGIVTSPTGAALQDMLNTLRRRYPLVEVILAPTSVQGEDAPQEITAAIERVNRFARPDVILVARGGGSLEELWAFNDERVVRAIVASNAPVITGIGHETDFTLSDFAADVRAPTPTAAAVQATPDVADIKMTLLGLTLRLTGAYQASLSDIRSRLSYDQSRLAHLSPLRQIQNDRQRLDDLSSRSSRTVQYLIDFQRARISSLRNQVQSLNPLSVLKRGFAIVQSLDGRIIRSISQVAQDTDINIRLADGQINAHINTISKGS